MTANEISSVADGALSGLPALEELVIRENAVAQLPALPVTMTLVDASHNNIGATGIHKEAFKVGHILSCSITSCHVPLHSVMSHHILSCPITSCHVPSHSVMSHHILSCPITFCHVPSHSVMSHHILSCSITSCHVPSHPVIFHHILDQTEFMLHILFVTKTTQTNLKGVYSKAEPCWLFSNVFVLVSRTWRVCCTCTSQITTSTTSLCPSPTACAHCIYRYLQHDKRGCSLQNSLTTFLYLDHAGVQLCPGYNPLPNSLPLPSFSSCFPILLASTSPYISTQLDRGIVYHLVLKTYSCIT